ncbi:hypothetical protein AUC68_08300 [Methyloceanibacter methanicus]|uniref:HTH cro/C1-type domain-containing protein n=1 Tax=Methyloceanibacter methanicus TaxID=1774968 RepID=A0A1E3VY11_9HYPH|nr:hypothetical protein AUC68_08300 [Methyloceanibacter methanicus]
MHKEIQKAFAESGLTQQNVANRLELERSTVNKRLTGQSNLTLRSVGELAWALDKKIVFRLVDEDEGHHNYHSDRHDLRMKRASHSISMPADYSTKSIVQKHSDTTQLIDECL